MKKLKKANLCITAGAMAILLCVLAVMPVLSMGFSAVPGALCYGTAPFGEHSVLQVESLYVSVEIPEAPDQLYENQQEIWEHITTFTSVYTLYNPTGERVTELMAIPFGALPEYTYGEKDTSPVLPHEGAYEIVFQGQSITPVVRHTLSEYSLRNDQFEVMDESAWRKISPLQDTKMTDEIFFPEQKVTVYTYMVSNPDAVEGGDFVLYTDNLDTVDVTATRIYTDHGGAYDGRLLSYAREDGQAFDIYVIGQDIGALDWRAENWDDVLVDSVTVSLQGKRETTFEALAMEYYAPDCGASEVDWYNAVHTFFYTGSTRCGVVDKFEPSSHDIRDHLQGWLLYEITLEPYERAELVTKTPAFPDIINRTQPNIYEYGYDLVGLARFASVGTVKFELDTTCYTLDPSSYYQLGQVPAGEYSLTMEGSEVGFLRFSICEKQNPVDIPSVVVYGGLILIVIIGLGFILLSRLVLQLITGAVVVGVFCRKRSKTSAENPSQNMPDGQGGGQE